MIHIVRGPEPEFLRSEKVLAAKDKLRKSFENAARQERFRFEISLLGQVKGDLMKMCNNKCAYCESMLDVVSTGDVENFRPKAGARGLGKEYAQYHYWWLAYDWNNLLVACPMCNQKYKRDFFPLEDESLRAPIGATGQALLDEKALLVDPCIDNPEEHFEFKADGTIEALTKKGKVSCEILGLTRDELVRKRKEVAADFLFRLERLSTSIAIEEEWNLKNYIEELFSDHPSQEYAAVLRAVFKDWSEANPGVWDSMKHLGDEKHFKKSKKPITAESASEIEKVEEQLSTIKRFSIKTIELENFRSIDKLSLSVLPVNEKDNRESWLLLLGDNGIGKSSILQALALALAGKKEIKRLKLRPEEFLKRGTQEGYVRIWSYENSQPVELFFNEKEFHTNVEEPPTFVMAYGSSRLLPKGNLKPDRRKPKFINISSLFDYSLSLEDVNGWLKKINEDEFNQRVAPALFDLLALKGKDRLSFIDGKLFIEQFDEDNDLERNSDGYKSSVGLVADIMQTLSIDSANYHASYGIVLIDELGNHLHPRWRMKIVNALRKTFPKLQFIVTTHEPLCLRGCSHGEVAVLLRDEEFNTRALEKNLLPDHNLLRIDQLLTSDLFGLINILDTETEKTYDEYYALLSKKEEERSPADKQKIDELSTQLAEKELQGGTPQLQVLYKVINEKYVDNIKAHGFKTKEELKKETVDQVKNLLDTKQLDWL